LRQSIIIEQRNIDYFESDSKLINTLTITYNELKQQVTKNISHILQHTHMIVQEIIFR
ncbi:unnamed protein product, partial [Didymodactylos carnosus]